MKYFAYGSNMLTARLAKRVKSAKPVGVGRICGWKLNFHKRSIDGSGKCSISRVNDESEVVHGIIFEMDDSEMEQLRDAEGPGYEEVEIQVKMGRRKILAMTFVAVVESVGTDLIPYDWYHALVVAGARQHRLPAKYTSTLISVPTQVDADLHRKSRLEAIKALPRKRTTTRKSKKSK